MGTDFLIGLVAIGQRVMVLNKKRFRLDKGKKSFTKRVVKHQNRLSREMADDCIWKDSRSG